MSLPQPPADMNRSERKAFRKLVQSLADRGIDAFARAGLAAEYVRMDARLATLREAENEAESGRKMPATRALNVALAEHRRIHVDLFRGAEKPNEAARVSDAEPEADRAWRARLWHGNKSLSHDELRNRYGEPSWAALLHSTHREWSDWQSLADEFRDRQRIPQERIEELRKQNGGALGFEVLAPGREIGR